MKTIVFGRFSGEMFRKLLVLLVMKEKRVERRRERRSEHCLKVVKSVVEFCKLSYGIECLKIRREIRHN